MLDLRQANTVNKVSSPLRWGIVPISGEVPGRVTSSSYARQWLWAEHSIGGASGGKLRIRWQQVLVNQTEALWTRQ